MQGRQPPGLPHSPWQLLEHLRIAQQDILDFCRNANYVHKKWPDDYWPKNPAPPPPRPWDASVAARPPARQPRTHPAPDPARRRSGKREVHGSRRMGVSLALGDDIDKARERARAMTQSVLEDVILDK